MVKREVNTIARKLAVGVCIKLTNPTKTDPIQPNPMPLLVFVGWWVGLYSKFNLSLGLDQNLR